MLFVEGQGYWFWIGMLNISVNDLPIKQRTAWENAGQFAIGTDYKITRRSISGPMSLNCFELPREISPTLLMPLMP